jgi:hypothetical protein
MMLVPCASQELPAPQLMQVQLPLRSPLPMLSALAAQHTSQPADHFPEPLSLTPAASQAADTPGLSALDMEATEEQAAGTAAGTPADFNGRDLDSVMVAGIDRAGRSSPVSGLVAAVYNSSVGDLMDMPDDVQAGIDSPRALSRAGHRCSVTPLPPRSRAGTPGPACKMV